MSYAEMDHAHWVEQNNAATNRLYGQRRSWKPLPEKLTLFQAQVADILGMVGGGIYNAPIAHKTIDWTYGHDGVSVVWRQELATFDYDQLTRLVFLCHEARIRCGIEAAGPRGVRISFWPRKAEGDIARRHPNLEEAVAAFRRYLPAGHRILQSREAQEPAPDFARQGMAGMWARPQAGVEA